MEEKIKQIARELITDEVTTNDQDKLNLLGTDSTYMMAFISAIEEEFEIELEDEMISVEFFTNYKYIVNCIKFLKS